MSSLCAPNLYSAPSSMPQLQAIIHFPQVNPLVPGLKLLEYLNMQRYLKTIRSAKSIKERSPRKSMVPRRIGIVRYNQNSTSIPKKEKDLKIPLKEI